VTGNQPTKEKEVPNIDTEAVKKAVAGIINNTSDKLSDKMKKWQHEQKEMTQARARSKQHSVILAPAVKAFHKETPKAIQATANLTRSATIAETLHRISALLQSQDCLSIHIVGADPVECETQDRIRTHFAPLARWINANIYSPKHLKLSLFGPNVPASMGNLKEPTTLLDPSQQQKEVQRLQTATARCFEASYHDWLGEQTNITGGQGNLPDIIFCFNAGIWGYDEWKPTIQSIVNLNRKIPFVVTSYTFFEAEDDYDVIVEVFKATISKNENSNAESTTMPSKQGCIWEPETNMYGSKLKWETATAVQGREYRENSAWQAWRF
jgi:hypothetical protein